MPNFFSFGPAITEIVSPLPAEAVAPVGEAPTAPVASSLPLPTVTATAFTGTTEPVAIELTVAPYTAETARTLVALHVVCLAAGTALPADPESLLTGNPVGSVPTPDLGGVYVIPVANVRSVTGPAGGTPMFQSILETSN